jgi:hypothetical protein
LERGSGEAASAGMSDVGKVKDLPEVVEAEEKVKVGIQA